MSDGAILAAILNDILDKRDRGELREIKRGELDGRPSAAELVRLKGGA